MTRDEVVSLMQIQLGFRTDQSTNLITCLQAAQVTLEREAVKPWFLLSAVSVLVTVADTRTIALPDDFLGENEEDKIFYIPADTEDDPVELEKDVNQQLLATYAREEGTPEAYAIVGTNMHIYPLPDDVYTLQWTYYAKDTVLSTNVENQWLAHFPLLLAGEAGMLLAPAMRNAEATAIFDRWRKEGRIQLYRENERRMHDNTDPQIGGPE